jgi:hypothetical protein
MYEQKHLKDYNSSEGVDMQNNIWRKPSKECLASIVVFRELANKGLELYDVLASYIKFIIQDQHLQQFTSLEIKTQLEKLFSCSVPDAVVIYTLNNKITEIDRDNGQFFLTKEITDDSNLINEKLLAENSVNNVLEELYRFVAEKTKHNLNQHEKDKVFNSLCTFLFDPNRNSGYDYCKYIGLWVMQNSENKITIDFLNKLKEGILITTGFEYEPEEYNKDQKWTTPLTLYYDVENLFSLEGLNGEPYKSLATELYDLIKTYNKKEKLITIKYFPATKREVESYYNAASMILRNSKRTFQEKTAMVNILNGCEDSTDAIEKKFRFFKSLGYKGVIEENDFEFSGDSIQYNIISAETIEKIKEQFPAYQKRDNELKETQEILNKINLLRKGQDVSFYKAVCFFVSETGLVLNLSQHSDELRPNKVPLATNTEYLTERFWAKANRRFSKITAKTANSIVSAQLVLADMLKTSISDKFRLLEEKYKEEKVNADEAYQILAEIKNIRTQPISATNAENIVEFIDSDIEEIANARKDAITRANIAEGTITDLQKEKEELAQKLEEIEKDQTNKEILEKKAKVSRACLAVIIVSVFVWAISGYAGKFFSNDFIKLILDIINTISIVSGLIGAIILFFKQKTLTPTHKW